MKHITAGLIALTPVAATAHEAGSHAPHLHPHGGEVILAALAVIAAGAGLYRMSRR
ncbi:MAG: hypothetical protein ACP5DX_05770 [Paracoccaceae bacterium]|jgi:hypothetical protein